MLKVCATPEGLDVVKNLSRTFTFMVKTKQNKTLLLFSTQWFSLFFLAPFLINMSFTHCSASSLGKVAPNLLFPKPWTSRAPQLALPTSALKLAAPFPPSGLRLVWEKLVQMRWCCQAQGSGAWWDGRITCIQSCLCIISLFFWQPYPHLLPSTHSTPSFWSPCLQSLHPVFPHIQLGEQEAGGAGLSLKHPCSEDLDSQSHLTCSEVIDISHSPFIGLVFHTELL